MAELNNIKNLLLPSIGNYKKAYNNYPKIDDIDKLTRLIYKDIKKINEEIDSVISEGGNELAQVLKYNSETDKIEASKFIDTSTFMGWQDFADSNTSEGSPIVQPTVNGGEVTLTNNNNDTLTDGNTSVNAETSVSGLNDLWSTTTNTFDFAGTGIEKNDLLSLRIHLNIAASIIAQDFSLRFDFYDSPGATGNFIFSLSQHVATEALSAGVFRERITTVDAFIGESIVNGSAKVYLMGTKSFEVEVIGFNIRIFKIAR